MRSHILESESEDRKAEKKEICYEEKSQDRKKEAEERSKER